MRPFLVPESVRELKDPYPSARQLLQAASGGSDARSALVQLWITEGIPYAFKDCPAVYASMRAWLADRLDIHPKEVSLTGSGRFGQSWVPKKHGAPFGPQSDLDLFLVSSTFLARLKRDFVQWREEYDRGEVTPRSDREATFWEDHRRRGPLNIQWGFLDSWMIPTWPRYETAQQLADTLWRLTRKLKATPGGPAVKSASMRVYRDFRSLAKQEARNLERAWMDVAL